MTYYIQAVTLTFIEALCCKIFFDTFLEKKYLQNRRIHKICFVMLFLGFLGIAFLPTTSYLWKVAVSIILIVILAYIQYKANVIQTAFLAVIYYGLVLCIDRIMLIILQFTLASRVEEILSNNIKATSIALLCKMTLFMLIIFLNKKFKPYGSFNLITDKEWIRFLFFPIITIICMSFFAIEDNNNNSKAVLMAAFSLVLSNFLVFYMIRDIVARERDTQKLRLSQERIKNQMDMYQYMECVYSEQRKKTHDFKNAISCIHGLIKSQNYGEAETYIQNLNDGWIEEIDYVNTNNAVVNSVINQKFKLAKKKGIPILMSINDLEKIMISNEDIVTILTNLLDNAIESCEKITEGTKLIKLRFLKENDKITISVKNPVAESVKISSRGVLTTKKDKRDHGIGINNIQSAVKKYGGESIYSCHEGFFTHSIIIELK